MIEYCNKKVMMITIGGLLVACVLLLYLEDALMDSHGQALSPSLSLPPSESSPGCNATGDCVPCTSFEMAMSNDKKSPFCVSGYKQKVLCGQTERFVACKGWHQLDKNQYFLFQALCLLALLASYGMVQRRQRDLQDQFIDRINQQLQSGV